MPHDGQKANPEDEQKGWLDDNYTVKREFLTVEENSEKDVPDRNREIFGCVWGTRSGAPIIRHPDPFWLNGKLLEL